MKINWPKEKDNLKSLLDNNASYESIGRLYNVTGACVKKAAKKLGFTLTQRRAINQTETFNKGLKKNNNNVCLNCGKQLDKQYTQKFCSNQCQSDYKHKTYIEGWKNGSKDGITGKYGLSRHSKKYLFEKYKNKCQICGWGETNKKTGKIPLEVHHIDGDYTNNQEENLQLLCPNCHSLTETYKNANDYGRKGRNKYN